VPFVLVFTKTDKQSMLRSEATVRQFRASLAEGEVEVPEIFLSSAKTRTGRSDILGFIESTLAKNNRK
jgi:GTP-binding protein